LSDGLTLSNFDGKKPLPLRVHDIMMGDSCLWVKTVNPETRQLEWALVNEQLTGLKWCGQFIIESNDLARDMSAVNFANPDWIENRQYYIPLKTKYVLVTTPDGEKKKLNLLSGDMADIISATKKEKKSANAYAMQFSDNTLKFKPVIISQNKEGRTHVEFLDDTHAKSSVCIGELEDTSVIIVHILGGDSPYVSDSDVDVSGIAKINDRYFVSVNTAIKMVELMSKLENGFIGSILYTLYDKAVNEKNTLTAEQRIECMIHELNRNDWYKDEKTKAEYKVYACGNGTVYYALAKLGNKIHIGCYVYDEESELSLFNEEENKEIRATMQKLSAEGNTTVSLKIQSAHVKEIMHNVSDMDYIALPYSIAQIKGFEDKIENYSYGAIARVDIKCAVPGLNRELTIPIAVCKDFKYFAVGDKSEVKTNMSSVSIIVQD
jgi:hypothetical protein